MADMFTGHHQDTLLVHGVHLKSGICGKIPFSFRLIGCLFLLVLLTVVTKRSYGFEENK